jgi:dipeptidyl-peptidase-3
MSVSIDAQSLKQYLADNPPAVVPLAIKPHFEALSDKEKLYAHHISMYVLSVHDIPAMWTDAICRACFAGTRIVLRQLSPESEPIYDFIIALHKHCNGDYDGLAKDVGLSKDDLDAYLNYAAQFLGNLGNYKSFGDSKFVRKLRVHSTRADTQLPGRPIAL